MADKLKSRVVDAFALQEERAQGAKEKETRPEARAEIDAVHRHLAVRDALAEIATEIDKQAAVLEKLAARDRD